MYSVVPIYCMNQIPVFGKHYKATIRSKLQKESNTSLLQAVIFVFSCWSQSFLLFLSHFIIFVVCHITKSSFTWLITGAYITIESIV